MNVRKRYPLGAALGLAGIVALSPLFKNESSVVEYVQKPTTELVSSQPEVAKFEGDIRREIVTPPTKEIEVKQPEVLSDEDYVNGLFSDPNSPFSLVDREEYETSHGFFPTKESYSGFYSTLCNNLANNSLESIAQIIPRDDPVWMDLPEVWNIVYNTSYDEETTLKDVYADNIPSKEDIASQWNPETRKTFEGIVELLMYDNMIDGFYLRESFRTRDLSNEVVEDIEIDMLNYMPFIRKDLGPTPDAARLENLISDYGRACILEIGGRTEEGTSDLISQEIYAILEAHRGSLESQYGNSQLTDMLKLNRALNDHSE